MARKREDPRAAALAAIEGAKADGQTKLKLVAVDPSVVKAACEVTTLIELTLTGGLKTLPEDIAQLVDLRRLTLARNALVELPAAIGCMTKLTHLDCSQNKLRRVPEDICALPALEELDLEDNQLVELPAALADLPDLRLNVRGNKLATRFAAMPNKRGARDVVAYLTGETDVMPRDERRAFGMVVRYLAPFTAWTFVDRRIVNFLGGAGYHAELFAWLKPHLLADASVTLFAEIAATLGSDDAILRASLPVLADAILRPDKTPTSYGHWLLARADAPLLGELALASPEVNAAIVELLSEHAFETFARLARKLLVPRADADDAGSVHVPHAAYAKLCAVDPGGFTPMVLDAFHRTTCIACRAEIGRVLADRCGAAYRTRSLEIAREALVAIADGAPFAENLPHYLDWAVRTYGRDVADEIGALARAEARSIRQAAGLALARLDPAVALQRALELIADPDPGARESGVLIASLLPGDPACARLDELLLKEPDDDVRDVIVARRSSDVELAPADVARRVAFAKARGKLAGDTAPWLAKANLPAVYWKTGEQLDADTVRFLFYRQQRVDGIVPDPEARGVFALIDRARSRAFATKLLALVRKQRAKDRFALTVLGMVGDDAIVEPLAQMALDGNADAATTLGLVGTPAAARALAQIADTFRTKRPAVRDAAHAAFDRIAASRGMMRYELADSLLPELRARTFKVGKTKIRATIGPDRELVFTDAAGKPIKDPSKRLAKAQAVEVAELRASITAASRSLRASLAHALASNRRWTGAAWRACFLANPLAFAFARALVWRVSPGRGLTGSFHIAADRTLADVHGATVTIGDETQISLLDPAELDGDGLAAWRAVLERENLTPPIAQL